MVECGHQSRSALCPHLDPPPRSSSFSFCTRRPCEFLATPRCSITANMAQSPMIAIPKKSTDEVDWTTPIRTIISQSYGENPDNYATECSSLQRCRQDAVRGAGSDLTGTCIIGPQPSLCNNTEKLMEYTISFLTLNQILWSTRTPRTTILGDQSLLSLARRIHQQTNNTNILSIRKGVHNLSNSINPFLDRMFPEPIRSRRSQTCLSLFPYLCGNVDLYQR